MFRRWLYPVVSRLLGVLLIAAAASKGYGSVVSVPSGDDLWDNRWFVTGLISFEAALGWWLVLGVFPCATRRVAQVCFAIFCCVSLAGAVAGKKSCGCFGTAAEVSPLIMAAFDAAACLALALSRPSERQERPHQVWLALAGSILSSVAALALTVAFHESPTLEVVPGKVSWGALAGSDSCRETVVLRNKGVRAVELVRVETTCPCLSARLVGSAIPPAGEAALCLQLDISREPDTAGALRVLVRGWARDGGVAFVLPVEYFVSNAGEGEGVVAAGTPGRLPR